MQLDNLTTRNVPIGELVAAALKVLGVEAGETPIYARWQNDDFVKVWIPSDLGLILAEHEYRRNTDTSNAEARITQVVPWNKVSLNPTVKAWWAVPQESTKSELLASIPDLEERVRAAVAEDLADRDGVGDFLRECIRRSSKVVSGQ